MRFPLLHHHVPHYFARHLSFGLEELYILVGLNDLALAAVMIFEPLYLYGVGLSLSQIAFFYFGVYLLYVLLLPFGGKIASRLGYPRTIVLASFFLILYYLLLFLSAYSPWLLWLTAAAYALQKTFYWPAMQADFIRFANHKQEGKELSGILSLSTIVNVIGPFLGGLLIKLYGFPALFGLVIGLILLSNLPLFFSKNPPTHEAVGFAESWRRMFAPERRHAFLSYLGYAEELIVMVFWPLAIFFVIRNAAEMGSVVALATLATALLTLYVGKLTDQHKQRALIRLGSTGSSLTWLARIAAVTPLLVFVVDTFSRLFKSILYVPLVEMTYERAVKEGPLKTVIFYEQSLALGKMLAALLLIGLFQFTSNLYFAFVGAAAAALLYRVQVR